MTKARLDGLYLMLLGSVVFILLGAVLERTATSPLVDFRVVYYPARCLLQHCDPYNEDAVLRIYRAEGGERASDTEKVRQIVTRHIYFPSTFTFSTLFAMLPWGPAAVLWMTFTVGSMIFASFLIWSLGATDAPVLAGVMIGFFLANSEVMIITGNAAGIVTSLCAVAAWCFYRERFVWSGILCLAVSLAIKPQDAGLVWLYFLLAGGVYRKRALQTLGATIAVSLPGVLWVWHTAPNWMRERHANVLAFSVHGGISDPGPTSAGAHGLDMMICLQTAISVFWDDPHIYNPVTYLICGPLLLAFVVFTLRFRPSAKSVWLGLAAIAALTMLPVYHRQLDAKLLLLTVPACAMLWAEGGKIGKLALLVNTAGFVLTGDVAWAIILGLIESLHLPTTKLWVQILTEVQIFPAPLILLVMAIFYLWAYVRCLTGESKIMVLGDSKEAPAPVQP